MFETHDRLTYDAAFARAHRERAAAVRALLTFRLPGRPLAGAARTA